MKQMLIGGRVWRADHRFLDACPIVMENGIIRSVGVEEACDEVIDARGLLVLPGLVDAHTHGRAGFDFCTASTEQMLQMKLDYARNGVTSVFATLASGSEAEWFRAIEQIEKCGFAGIHLEGNFLNPQKRGAHRTDLLVPLTERQLDRYLSGIHIPCHLTAAFELDADGSFAACAKRHGVTMGLGHTNATAAEAQKAVERGVTSFTHLYNTMPLLHHREGGAASVGLISDAYVELIADGLHICPEMICLAYKCKAPDKFVLITDSMEATGCPDGEYAISGQPVLVRNGRAETLDGALAGSTLDLWTAVQNLMQFAKISLADAVACATINPAKMLGIDKTVGSIDVGKRADLLLVDEGLAIRTVFCESKKVL